MWIAFRIVFLLMIPNKVWDCCEPILLWIAFRIVFLLMIPNFLYRNHHGTIVVNCFQNCIFTYDSQHQSLRTIYELCCELLSELYFYLWFPTKWRLDSFEFGLWIAFRIVFLLMIPNIIYLQKKKLIVVNCFQNCIFTYDSQRQITKRWKRLGCELLSELYFYLWFPTCSCDKTSIQTLWIAFRIVFLLMIPNQKL